MSLSKTTAGRLLVALVALGVLLSAVTVGVVAQTETGPASAGDAEPNDSMANATPVEYGEEIDATLSSPDDVDYYAVNATAGDAILPRLHLTNMFEGSAIQVDVVAPTGEVTTELTNDLMSGPQNSVGAADTLSGSDVAYTGDVMESNGTYYVRVAEATNLPTGGPETNASDTYRYSLTVNRTAVDEYEPNENATTATPVAVGESLTAAFAGYDSDVYALDVTAGENYTVNVTHPNDLGSDYATKVMYVYDNRSLAVDDPAWQYAEDGKSPYYRGPTGPTVATSGPGSVDFTAETNGTYYVQVVQDLQNWNLVALDEYELTVTGTDRAPSDGAEPLPDEDDAEPDDSPADAARIAYGEEVNATLSSPDDVDYYAVNATAGDGLVPRLHLENMFEGSLIQVDVVAPSGEVTTEHTNDQIHGPTNVAGEARPPSAPRDTAYTGDVMESNGTYYVRVSAPEEVQGVSPKPTNDSATYRYDLTATREDLDEYDPNENGANATPVEVGESVDAVFAGYDNDVYAVNLTAGERYNVSIESDGNISKQVNVFDDASLASDEDDYFNEGAVAGQPDEGFVQDATVTFTVAENGTYYVELTESSVNSQLLTRSNYTLAVTESERPPKPDADGDGLPDTEEERLGTDPTDPDSDGDGIRDGEEVQLGTDPTDCDSDDDELVDGEELNFGTNPTSLDTDGDGLDDGREVIELGTDPLSEDTDDDGTLDGDEV